MTGKKMDPKGPTTAQLTVGGGNNGHARTAAKKKQDRALIVNPEATKRFFTPLRLLLEDAVLDQPYRQHSWTYGCIKALAHNIASVPFKILTGDERNPTEVDSGPWVDLFDFVNPMMDSRPQFWEAIVIWLSLSGECMIVKEGRGNERVGLKEIPKEMWPLDGRAFTPIIDKMTKLPDHWVLIDKETQEKIRFRPHELVRPKYYNPYHPLRGLAPWEPAANSVRTDFKAIRFNESYFDNDATPGGIIQHPDELTQDQRDEIRKGHEDRHQGQDRRRRVMLLEGGLKWIPTSDSLRDMEFNVLRSFSRDETMGVFKVPASELSLHANLNYATALSADRGFWTKTLIPIMRLIEDTLWAQLFNVRRPSLLRAKVMARQARQLHWMPPLHRAGRFDIPGVDDERPDSAGARPGQIWGEFDLAAIEALRQNLDLKITTAQRMLQLGYPLNMINERLEMGMPDVSWGDIPFAPPGGIPLNQIMLPDDTTTPPVPGSPGGSPAPDPGEPSAVPESTPAAEDTLSREYVVKQDADTEKWCVYDTITEEKTECFDTEAEAEAHAAKLFIRPPADPSSLVEVPDPTDEVPVGNIGELSDQTADMRYIKKVGDEWCVFSKDGDKLGCHDTEEKAKAQLAAVEASKGYKCSKEVEDIRKIVTEFAIRRGPERDKQWRSIAKVTFEPFEPRFRNRFRRYLMELRTHQLRRLGLGSKLKAKHEPLELPDNIAGGRGWGDGLVLRAPSPLEPGDVDKVLFGETPAAKRIQTVHHPLYVQITGASMDQMFKELGGNFAFDVADPRVAEAIAERELKLANVPKTIRKNLHKSLTKGIEQGESIKELADRIKTEFNRLGGAKSFTIARTEVAGATNTARHLTMEEEGVERHEWITARDEAVRPSHRKIDGQKRDIGAVFGNNLIHPNDPNGPPGEVINCRCVTVAL